MFIDDADILSSVIYLKIGGVGKDESANSLNNSYKLPVRDFFGDTLLLFPDAYRAASPGSIYIRHNRL